jgi:carbon monoxide dehydrogenase subunit G
MTSRKADWSKRTAKKTPGTTVALDDVVVVPVSPATAWKRLEDVPLVASCLPGLDLSTLVAESGHVFRARMVNTVMGISANWDLRATIEPDAPRRLLKVGLEGADERLNMKLDGTAAVVVRSDEVGDNPGQALLDYEANLRVDGSLAAMGGPVIRTILADSIAQFVTVIGGMETQPTTSSWHVRIRARLRSAFTRLRHRFTTGTAPVPSTHESGKRNHP